MVENKSLSWKSKRKSLSLSLSPSLATVHLCLCSASIAFSQRPIARDRVQAGSQRGRGGRLERSRVTVPDSAPWLVPFSSKVASLPRRFCFQTGKKIESSFLFFFFGLIPAFIVSTAHSGRP